MWKRGRGQQAPSSWRFLADLLTGRLERRILALEAQTEALAERVAELEKVVARQDEKLKALTDLVPRVMMQQDDDAEAKPALDRRKLH